MSSIYLINVGANTNHSSQARMPFFHDKSFVFVSYPIHINKVNEKKNDKPKSYCPEMQPFTNPQKQLKTHNDPNWDDMTYGDVIQGRHSVRGSILKHVEPNDILLFWGLLYCNECSERNNHTGRGDCWNCFSSPLDKHKGWYLLGAMQVEIFVETNDELKNLSNDKQKRVKGNAHYHEGQIQDNCRIFLGKKDNGASGLFDKAVPLWIPNNCNGEKCKFEDSLLYNYFHTVNNEKLSLNGKKCWYRWLRICRKIWDINISNEKHLAEQVRDEIKIINKGIDILKNA